MVTVVLGSARELVRTVVMTWVRAPRRGTGGAITIGVVTRGGDVHGRAKEMWDSFRADLRSQQSCPTCHYNRPPVDWSTGQSTTLCLCNVLTHLNGCGHTTWCPGDFADDPSDRLFGTRERSSRERARRSMSSMTWTGSAGTIFAARRPCSVGRLPRASHTHGLAVRQTRLQKVAAVSFAVASSLTFRPNSRAVSWYGRSLMLTGRYAGHGQMRGSGSDGCHTSAWMTSEFMSSIIISPTFKPWRLHE